MSKQFVFLIAVVLAAVDVVAAQVDRVEVTNFPQVQEISGSVSVPRPIPHTALVRHDEAIVPPVDPQETTALVEGGTLSVAGFPAVTLSLMGRMRSEGFTEGSVGVLLVPVESSVSEVFDLTGRAEFSLRLTAPVSPWDGTYFSAQAARLPVGFSGYRILYFNTSNHPATVRLFAYLTH